MALDSAGGVGEMLDFFGRERALQDRALAIGEPFLEHLVAAKFVGPYSGGDVAPVGAGVEVDVGGCLAERGQDRAQRGAFVGQIGPLDDATLARHYRVDGSVVPPSRRQREIIGGHVVSVHRRGYGDGCNLRAERRSGDSRHGSIGVEQGREFAPARRRFRERRRRAFAPAVGPAGEWDSGPFHLERSRVGLAVGGIVESGEDMVKQVFHADAQPVEVASGGT